MLGEEEGRGEKEEGRGEREGGEGEGEGGGGGGGGGEDGYLFSFGGLWTGPFFSDCVLEAIGES